MNRSDRRRAAKQAGINWRDHAGDRHRERAAIEAERVALRMSPEEARATLARWAAQPGRSQAEIDALNMGPAGSNGVH